MTLTFRKQRRAMSKDDYETWIEDDVANTLNAFDMGNIRSTNIVVMDQANTLAQRDYKQPQAVIYEEEEDDISKSGRESNG